MKKMLGVVVVVILVFGVLYYTFDKQWNDYFETKYGNNVIDQDYEIKLVIDEMTHLEGVVDCNIQSTINGSYIIDVSMIDGSEIQMIMDNTGNVTEYEFY